MIDNQLKTKNSIDLSIVLVVYNGEKYIEECLLSLIEEKNFRTEILVIDGVSTDGTLEIIKKYNNEINIFVSEKDDGLYHAMNKGLSFASGKLIGILGCDDRLTKGSVDKILDLGEATNFNKVIFGCLNYLDRFDESRKLDVDITELNNRMIPHPATFVPKIFYKKFGGFNTNYAIAADYDLILRFRQNKIQFVKTNYVLVESYSDGFSSKFKNRFRSAWETYQLRIIYSLKNNCVSLILLFGELIFTTYKFLFRRFS